MSDVDAANAKRKSPVTVHNTHIMDDVRDCVSAAYFPFNYCYHYYCCCPKSLDCFMVDPNAKFHCDARSRLNRRSQIEMKEFRVSTEVNIDWEATNNNIK